MYVRFVYMKTVGGMSSREGLFQAAEELADDPFSAEQTVAQLDAIRKWFAEHLDVPKRFSKSSSKGYYRRAPKGLSWFKASAAEHISKAFELKSILNEHGYAIEILKEKRIGYVIYEDEHQVVAEPFADTLS